MLFLIHGLTLISICRLFQPEEQDLGQRVQVRDDTRSTSSLSVPDTDPARPRLSAVTLKGMFSVQVRWILIGRQKFSVSVPEG